MRRSRYTVLGSPCSVPFLAANRVGAAESEVPCSHASIESRVCLPSWDESRCRRRCKLAYLPSFTRQPSLVRVSWPSWSRVHTLLLHLDEISRLRALHFSPRTSHRVLSSYPTPSLATQPWEGDTRASASSVPVSYRSASNLLLLGGADIAEASQMLFPI